MRISDWSSDVCSSDLSAAQNAVIADASATKIFSTESLQEAGRVVEEIIGRFGDAAEPGTAELPGWLDRRTKQNRVVTERQSCVSGKDVSVRVDLGGRRLFKKKTNQ